MQQLITCCPIRIKNLVKGDEITVVADEEDRFYRDIEINEDNTDFKITSIRRDKSLFDQFNTVVVFGDGVRASAKITDLLKKQGREVTKEMFDFTITNKNRYKKPPIAY